VETADVAGATRSIAIADFHRLPGSTPHIETVLKPGELITAVRLPAPVAGTHLYQKVRDRASYAFATVSLAAIVRKDAPPQLALGGLAHKPWRVEAAEPARGASAVAEAILAGASTTPQNAFKKALAQRMIGAALRDEGAAA
jgi:xanthine dehydrogenase YagS FAD-binding subunit